MLAIILTHADAQKVDPRRFRALSEEGRAQVGETAARFRAIAGDLVPNLNSKQILIAEILSSPLARCVETVLRFSDAIQDFTTTSDIRISHRLREQRAGQLSAGDIVSVLDVTSSEVVLLCTHGDLAGALPVNAALGPEAAQDGWFKLRPVLTIVEYERGSKWEEAKVLCCESPANNWETLLAKQPSA
jgi:phosphohistidine phosphatase SixA